MKDIRWTQAVSFGSFRFKFSILMLKILFLILGVATSEIPLFVVPSFTTKSRVVSFSACESSTGRGSRSKGMNFCKLSCEVSDAAVFGLDTTSQILFEFIYSYLPFYSRFIVESNRRGGNGRGASSTWGWKSRWCLGSRRAIKVWAFFFPSFYASLTSVIRGYPIPSSPIRHPHNLTKGHPPSVCLFYSLQEIIAKIKTQCKHRDSPPLLRQLELKIPPTVSLPNAQLYVDYYFFFQLRSITWYLLQFISPLGRMERRASKEAFGRNHGPTRLSREKWVSAYFAFLAK